MKELFNREPAISLSLIQALVAVSTSFGLNLTAEQVGAISTVGSIVIGLLIRRKVSPIEGGKK